MAGKLNVLSAALLVTTTLVGTQLAVAQNPPTATRPATIQGGPQGGQGGMGDPMETVKTQIKATNEEWQIVGPAIRKVVNARRTAEGTLVNGTQGGFGRGGRGGRGPGGGGGPGGNDAFGGPANNMPGRGGMRGPGGGMPGGPTDGPPPQGDNAGGPPGAAGGPQQGGPPNQQGPGGPNGGQPGGNVMAGPPGMGAPGGGGPVANAMNDLKTAATDGRATADEIKSKIDAVRAERKKARDALANAVEELKAVVSPEQEAVLIGLGYLE